MIHSVLSALTPSLGSKQLSHSILDEPHVAFGREICGDLEAGLRREWLVTNGLGGYASPRRCRACSPAPTTACWSRRSSRRSRAPCSSPARSSGSRTTVRGIRSRPTSSARRGVAGGLPLPRIVPPGGHAAGLDVRRRRCPGSSAGSGWWTAPTRPSLPTGSCAAAARSSLKSRRSSRTAASMPSPPARAGTSASTKRRGAQDPRLRRRELRSGCARIGRSSGPTAPGGGISTTGRRPSAAWPPMATCSRPARSMPRCSRANRWRWSTRPSQAPTLTPAPLWRRPRSGNARSWSGRMRNPPIPSCSNSCSPPTSSSWPGRWLTIRMAGA